MTTPQYPIERRQAVTASFLAHVVWPAFLGAVVGVAVLFSLVDPAELTVVVHHLDGSRLGGYTLGFLLCWAVMVLACATTWFLLRTAHRTE